MSEFVIRQVGRETYDRKARRWRFEFEVAYATIQLRFPIWVEHADDPAERLARARARFKSFVALMADSVARW